MHLSVLRHELICAKQGEKRWHLLCASNGVDISGSDVAVASTDLANSNTDLAHPSTDGAISSTDAAVSNSEASVAVTASSLDPAVEGEGLDAVVGGEGAAEGSSKVVVRGSGGGGGEDGPLGLLGSFGVGTEALQICCALEEACLGVCLA